MMSPSALEIQEATKSDPFNTNSTKFKGEAMPMKPILPLNGHCQSYNPSRLRGSNDVA